MPILLDRHFVCRHLPIFPGRFHPSIFGTIGLNFRVRYGNGWTPDVIDTDYASKRELNKNSKYWHFPIFPGRFHPSIFGTIGLNFRVRYGNGWTPDVISTNFSFSDLDSIPYLFCKIKTFFKFF